jgi:acyl-CoA thioester hydrolase
MSQHGEQAAEAFALDGALQGGGHLFHARVYYADTDFSGFVYHARYLEFLERGRTDYLRLSGIRHTAMAKGEDSDEALIWVVRRMEIDFLAPARMDDVISVQTHIAELSGARVVMHQRITRGQTLLIAARVEAAIVTPLGRPRRFPKAWAARLLPPPSQTPL